MDIQPTTEAPKFKPFLIRVETPDEAMAIYTAFNKDVSSVKTAVDDSLLLTEEAKKSFAMSPFEYENCYTNLKNALIDSGLINARYKW